MYKSISKLLSKQTLPDFSSLSVSSKKLTTSTTNTIDSDPSKSAAKNLLAVLSVKGSHKIEPQDPSQVPLIPSPTVVSNLLHGLGIPKPSVSSKTSSPSTLEKTSKSPNNTEGGRAQPVNKLKELLNMKKGEASMKSNAIQAPSSPLKNPVKIDYENRTLIDSPTSKQALMSLLKSSSKKKDKSKSSSPSADVADATIITKRSNKDKDDSFLTDFDIAKATSLKHMLTTGNSSKDKKNGEVNSVSAASSVPPQQSAANLLNALKVKGNDGGNGKNGNSESKTINPVTPLDLLRQSVEKSALVAEQDSKVKAAIIAQSSSISNASNGSSSRSKDQPSTLGTIGKTDENKPRLISPSDLLLL